MPTQRHANPVSMKIGTRFIIIISCVLLASAVVITWFVNHQLRRLALSEAKAKAMIILDQNLAIHTYFSHDLKPSVFKVIDRVLPPSYFDAHWMSSTHAVRDINAYRRMLGDHDFYYKECAINARSPKNEADAFEAAFIQRLNNEPELKSLSLVRDVNGHSYFQVLRRGEVMEQSCLRCHSTPQAAPADMVEAFGAQRSFGRSPGEVVSAISIRVPLDEAYALTRRITILLSLGFVAVLVVVGLVVYLANRSLFTLPLRQVREQAMLMADDEENLGHAMNTDLPGEWNQLACAFNKMSANLHDIYEDLEWMVDKRTEALQKALSEVRQLSGMLPICANCKSIRDDQGYWRQLEAYISEHSEAMFSHSICPACARKLYPELYDEDGNLKKSGA